MRLRRDIAGLVFVAAALAAGCGADSSTSTETVEASIESVAAEEQPETSPSVSTEPLQEETEAQGVGAPIVRTDDDETRNDQFVSPVFDALGFDLNDRQDAERAYVANAEELTRACMADAGFEYVSNTPEFSAVSGPAISRQLELSASISPEQFITEYGYGISTLTALDFNEDAVDSFVDLLFGPAVDQARSPEEQVAYEMALTGMSIQGLNALQARQQAFGNNIFRGLPGSCRAHGFDNADNSVNDKYDGLYTLLGDEYEAISEEVLNDPRILDLTSDWQACMASHGYSYENPDDIRDELFVADGDLRSRFLGSREVLELFEAVDRDNLVAMNSVDRLTWLERNGAYGGFSMVPDLQAAHDELIAFELTIARQDADCSDESIYFEVLREFEQAFVEDHAAQLQLISAGES